MEMYGKIVKLTEEPPIVTLFFGVQELGLDPSDPKTADLQK